MRAIVTGSRLGLAADCPSSHALPWVTSTSPAAAFGSAFHDHMATRAAMGVEVAMEDLAQVAATWGLSQDEADRLSRLCSSFEWCPPRRGHLVVEQPLCLMLGGSVRPVVGGRGEYDVPGDGVLPLTVDLAWSEPTGLVWTDDHPIVPAGDVLWVIDYKTGGTEPAEGNRQLHAEALLVARWCGATSVVAAVVHPGRGQGEWDCVRLEAAQMVRIGSSIIETVADVLEALKAPESERRYSEGPQCAWCPALSSCPAKIELLRKAIGGELVPAGQELVAYQARRIAAALPVLRRVLGKAEEALKAHVVAHGPIDMGDGTRWGPHQVDREELVPDVVMPLLAAEIGAARAAAALKMELPKTAVETAVKEAIKAGEVSGPASKRIGRVLGQAREADGIRTRVETWWTAR